MDQSAKISVIITMYNVEKFAHDCISSVINQTYQNLEILCINDGSTDRTVDIANEFAAKDSRIKVITQANTGCAAGAINKGLDVATGDDIYVLDGDDTLSLDALEKMKARQIETRADMVISDKWLIHPNHPEKNWAFIGVARQAGKTNDILDRSIILTGKEAFLLTLASWKITGKGLYKRSLFDTIRYNTKGTNGDEVTIREMFLKANKIAFSEGTYYYMQHEKSITTNRLSPRYFDMFQSDEDLHNLLVAYDFEPSVITEWQKLRIKRLGNYRRHYSDNKQHLSTEDRIKVEKIFKDAYRDWAENTKNCSLYLKLKYRFNYLKRRFKRDKKKAA